MSVEGLHQHLKTCATTVARCWVIERSDGQILGFTDHDQDLTVAGHLCVAETGMTAKSLHQTTGLSVDNSEALGALSDTRITEADINAGLYDLATVRTWLVNWTDTQDLKLVFSGTLGEIRWNGAAFEVELRGLTESLNTTQGRVYQRPCGAVLGDDTCSVDMTDPNFHMRRDVLTIEDRLVFRFADDGVFPSEWFLRGRFIVETGAGASLTSWIKRDYVENGERVVETWEPLRANIQPGDTILLHAGCDKRQATCRDKFSNILNFQGFPYIPGEDWLMSVPQRGGQNDGSSLS